MGVICASVDCKYIDEEANCCRLREIKLSEHYMHTVNEGFQHFWRCKQYEMSDESKRIYDQFVRLMQKDGVDTI